MNKKYIIGIGIISGMLFFSTPGFSQVEFTAFGLYNMNITYSSEVEVNSVVEASMAYWYPEWGAFFSSVIAQKNGMGFGGRIAYNLTPSTGFEAGVEYIMAETEFTEGLVDNFLDRLATEGISDWLETATESGGNIIRYYGNAVFNFPSSGPLTPYATFGLGFTQFKIGQGVGPEVDVKSPVSGERFHLYYLDTTALTFNGGLGIKALFSSNFGFRIDARIFVCDPDFEQMLRIDGTGGNIIFDEGSVIQDGTHIDTSLNLGLLLKF